MAAEPGISQQIQLAIKMLNSSNRMEKLSACRELSKAENRGVEPVWFALMKKNEDGDKDVRREVAVGLGIVSNKGEVKTVRCMHVGCSPGDVWRCGPVRRNPISCLTNSCTGNDVVWNER